MHTEPSIDESAHQAILLAAKQAFEFAVRNRAHAFSLQPSLLEQISIGLSKKTPRQMRLAVTDFIREEMTEPRHNFSFDGVTGLVNLHGALRYATLCCAIENREDSR